jgi:fermentation-respiration switch protein FrsA (DUF1100 family)
MREFLIVLTALCCAVAIFLLATYFVYVYVFKRRRREALPDFSETAEDEHGRKAFSKKLVENFSKINPSEEVYINSYDKLRLYGRIYLKDERAPFEIAFHGYRSIASRDFSGGGYETLLRGHNLLLVDQRAHGKSDGKTISFGINERRDVISWVNYIAKRYPQNDIILLGISMGASSVLMASDMPLLNVKMILADCPYSAPGEIIRKVVRDLHWPPILIYPIIRLGARIFGKFDLEESSPVTAVKKARIPILIIHGEGDNFVPVSMSRKIKESNTQITLETFPCATHGLSYVYDRERYVKITNEFIKTNLKKR